MEETENNAAQPGTDGKSSSQDHDGIVAPNQNLTTTETTGSQDNGSLFSSELESLLNTDTSVPTSSSMKPSTGFTVSEAHLLQQVLDRFALNRRIESGSISLRLHPAELGELQLDVLVQRSTVQLQVTAQNPQVQELLEQNLPRLREALAQHGFSLDRMEVTLAENSQGELLQQGGDTEGRYPATLSSGSVRADWSQNMDEAIESEIILAESNGFAGLNIHI
ncbi:MAG: hypothetical protein BWK76_00725 [Desulfobulbaceae bacterium A2]|nr:MAG: hypothetical protein BWK76_00725 [Desulfobulbaceae bacterium A2]